ncbi:kinase-like domain-containing protein [Xylaria longipes]|nr:kinase-like domain-containing protein [Xylaria longipes]RYC59956.1 hypothetical protein CHU98_g6248 [Xylaria longipes]
MSSYTPITLPYFAPNNVLPAPLPTLKQVLSSENYLILPLSNLYGKSVCIVQIGEHFVAKYGKDVRSVEGESMLFVRQHTMIPVPQVYAIYTFSKDQTMIIMDFVKGISLQECFITMSPRQLEHVREQLKAQVVQLRRIPHSGYYGAIGRRPLLHIYSGRKFGPFDNFRDMISAKFDLEYHPRSAQRFANIKKFFLGSLECISTALGHSYPVFTHGDLHEANVIVQPNGTPVIIDWETAGFFPIYHERFTTDLLASRFNFLDDYPYERQVIDDANTAWVEARREEPDSAAESGSDSQSGSRNDSDYDS